MVTNVNSMFSVSPTGTIGESAKPPAIAAVEAATFQAMVPVMAAAANNPIGPTGAAPGTNPQGPNIGNQTDQSSQSTSSTSSQSSSSGGSSGTSAPLTSDKPVTVQLTTTTTTDTTQTGQTNTATNTGTTTTTSVVTQTTDNTPHVTPTGSVTNVSDSETASSQIGSFNLMSQVSVANPGSPTAYVNGSAALVSATASAGVPPAFINASFLSSLVSVGPDGTVHYDNSTFSFLAAGQSLSYTINFDVQSGSDTLHLSLTFTVTGINEAPTITFGGLDTAIGTIIDDTHATAELAAGTLTFKDADSADVHSVSFAAKSGPAIGSFAAKVVTDTTETDTTAASAAGSVIWAFAADKAHAQSLAAGETETEVFTITLSDGQGGTTSQDVSVTVVGVNDAPTMGASSTTTTGTITEDAQGHETGSESASGTIGFNDVDLKDTHTKDASDPIFVWKAADGTTLTLSPSQVAELTHHSTLTLVVSDSTGTGSGSVAWTYTVADSAIDFLADGETLTVKYDVTVTDNNGASITQPLTLTVAGTGTNDAPTVSAAITSTASEDAAPYSVNLLAGASDPDSNDVLHVDANSVSGLAAGVTLNGDSLSVDPNAYNHLAVGEHATVTVNCNVIDGHGGSVAQSATITITGANDAPTVSAAISSTASEDDAPYSVNLLSGASDPDSSDVLHVDANSVTGLAAGVTLNGDSLSVDPNAYDYLAVGEHATVTVNYNVIDGHGGAVAQSATITITGANDQPTVSAAISSTASEDDAPYSVNVRASGCDRARRQVLHVAANSVTGRADRAN